jgi:XTP/dITP diphosphohydrolase
MKLLIATHNRHKLAEIRDIFGVDRLELLTMDDYPGLPEVVEDGVTFEQNAAKKARETALKSGLWALADDSGLEVSALNGAPGVYSARYAGEPVSYPANNAKLLDALRGVEDRKARFRCVIALSSPGGQVVTVEGECTGRIVEESRGDGGFGYDPLFVPDGFEQTFAEMASELKNRISHRARALTQARDAWSHLLGRLAGT